MFFYKGWNMKPDNDKFEYIKNRRRKFLTAFFLIVFFGILLFSFSRYMNREKKINETEEGGVTELYRNIVAEEMEAMEAVSKNILDEPFLAKYRIEEDRLTLLSNINLRGKVIKKPVFKIKKHGKYYFSDSFASEELKAHCKGVMEEGFDKFFIYYCSENE